MFGRQRLHRFVFLSALGTSRLIFTDAFATPRLATIASRSRSHDQYYMNVVSESLAAANNNDNDDPPEEKIKLSRPERKAIERKKKQRQQQPKRKQNPKYNLDSNEISQFTQETSTADDVMRAIKRAQNNHDNRELEVIADFLIDECDVGFAYGYRGSLLARLAVAALHFGNHVVAHRAIEIRRIEYRSSMLPMESAAIIRGLLRVHNATDALAMLHDELSLPLEVRNVTGIFYSCLMNPYW
jgi:hypothetical protein